MTPQQIAHLEVAELERWHGLPSRALEHSSTRAADVSAPALFGLCLACALFALIAQAPHGGTY